jgi:Ca2+-binding EF-hand superfamily protein
MEVLYGEDAMDIDRTTWADLIKEADMDGDGRITFEEFKEAIVE